MIYFALTNKVLTSSLGAGNDKGEMKPHSYCDLNRFFSNKNRQQYPPP